MIFSGGPDSVTREGSPRPPQSVYSLGVPVLGICYGQQVMMQDLGGQVEGGKISGGGGTAEFGRAYVTPADQTDPFLSGWFAEGREQVWMSHGDHVSRIARASRSMAPRPTHRSRSPLIRSVISTPCSFIRKCTTRRTARRSNENFVKLAGFKGDWTMGAYRAEAIAKIRAQVGDKKVICGLSGGVDSSVCCRAHP